jgi:hypothetical protein
MQQQQIPTPQVLDPDRVLVNARGDLTADHESRAKLLEVALHDSCAYAQQLWHDLDAMRGYLLNSLPPDPRTPGVHTTVSASPTGPEDDTGWDNWINAYSAVTSVLCGPHGDSGFGVTEARHAANLRRTAPIVRVHADHPGTGTHIDQEHAQRAQAATERRPQESRGPRFARVAGTTMLVLLALRGLRPHRRPFA